MPKKRPLLKTRKPLQSHTGIVSRQAIKPVSDKRKKLLQGSGGYIAFSKYMRESFPDCQIRWKGVCTGKTEGVHHVIKRSQGGALKPGPLAEQQGQEFAACCNACNGEIERRPKQAREIGLVKSNPLMRHEDRPEAKILT